MSAPLAFDAPGLLTVVVTDLVDSTRIVAELGDHAAHAALQRHDRLARDLLAAHRGREIDKSDGFLLLFEQPADAVTFALRYHEALRALSVETGVQWRARAGIQLGELFVQENRADDIARGAKPLEVDGLAKPLAARLAGLAQGGQTLLGAAAFDLAQRGGVELPGQQLGWLAHGRYRIKGSEPALEVFEVGVVGHAPLAPPPDGDKAQREISEDERLTLGWRPGPGLEIPQRTPWRLARKLGAGGFGEVWLAEHPQTGGRRVFKFCHDAERLRSLKREVTVFRLLREALGDRDDVVRIIDWQLDSAPFFIEAEHVDGGDLMSWAERHGGLAAIPLEHRLEVVAQAADALAAAHSIGVLHKDIKPGNILVRDDADGRPHALLTDFGIGMVTDRRQLLAHGITVAGLTEFLDTPGTAGSQLYMAPETLQGKAATIQADLYALGVVLYELVAGTFKPLAPGWQRDIDDELLAADIASLVDGDPARRPASAARVAEALRRLPERRERIAAERRAAADQEATLAALARATRRRRWALALASSFAVVATLVGASAWQAMQARDEAELRRTQAEQLIGFMLDDLRDKLKQVGRLDVMDAVGAAAMAHFEAIPPAQLGDADLAARAKALYQIGDVRVSQGDLDGAARAMQESLALATALAARAPADPQRQFELAQSHYWVGFVAFRRSDHDAAMREFERYREIAAAQLDQRPDDERWQVELGYAYSNIASVLEASGQRKDAVPIYRQLLQLRQSRVARSPNDPRARADLATIHNKLALALESMLQLHEALEHYGAEVALLDVLVAEQPQDLPLAHRRAVSQTFPVRVLLQLGHPELAVPLQQQAMATLATLVAGDPSNLRWQRDRVAALALGASVELDRGATAAFESLLREAETAHAPIADAFPELAASLALQQAHLLAMRAEPSAADAAAQRAIDVAMRHPRADNGHQLTAAEANLLQAELAARRGDEAAAARLLREGLGRLDAVVQDDARSRALRIRLRLASGQPAGDEALVLLSNGYRQAQFVAKCREHGIPLPTVEPVRWQPPPQGS
jgi:serine/threonine protein kinase/class 3 adenylate cyclase